GGRRRRRAARGQPPQAALPRARRPAQPRPRARPRRRRRLLHAGHGGDPRAGRRVRVRQDDALADRHAAHRADRRQGRLPGPGHLPRRALGDAPAAPRHPDGLPGPVRLAEPAQAHRRDHRRAAAPARDGPRRHRRAHARPPATRRPGARARQPLPARVLRRPAPAHRHRAGARARAAADRARRAGLGARRLRPGADRQPARRPAGRDGPGLPVRGPRPVGGAPRVQPHRGDVPRADHGALAVRGALHQADPPLHRGAAVGDPRARPGAQPQPPADGGRRRAALAAGPAVGLRLPHALSARPRPVRPRGAPAQRLRPRARRRLPLPAQHHRRRGRPVDQVAVEPARQRRQRADPHRGRCRAADRGRPARL
ncbi:MAG: Oligopeptide transport ATP-binding protein OppF, partial [uncultured Solirubrobacteraceae bacterium]